MPVWHAGFIWDDDAHVTGVPSVVGHAGLGQIWTSAAANYFPLTTSTFWLIHAFAGLNPSVYHGVDVALHALGAGLLWVVLRELRVRGAWIGAMLWALHPVQVESAAWISETKNTQSAVFFLLSVLSFLRWLGPEGSVARGGGFRFYFFAWVGTALAILSKSSTVMLPVVLGLCWWWRAGHWHWRWLPWLLPFFAISAAAAGWTIWEQQFHSGAIGPDWTLSHLERVIVAGNDLWFYVGKLFWPQPLMMIYPRWTPASAQLVSYLPALAAVGLILLLWWHRRHFRVVLFAALYFGVSLFPVLGFFNVYFYRFSFVADHFQYLASMGALALAGAGLSAVGDWIGQWSPRFAPASGLLLLCSLGFLSWRHCHDYQNDETLWRSTLARNSSAWLAHFNLGVLLDRRPDQASEAIVHYEATLRLYPEHWKAHTNLGNVLLGLPGRMPKAAAHYEAALRIKSDLAEPHYNLGNILMRTGRATEAIAHYQAAIEINPDFAAAHFNLAGAIVDLPGRRSEAIQHLEAVVRLQPDFAEAHFDLGVLLLEDLQQRKDAVAHLETAVRLQPGLEATARQILNQSFEQRASIK